MSITDLLIGSLKQLCFLILCVLFSYFAIAQTKLTGRITGSDGKPVVGATITVKGTTTATQTDNKGDFVIDASPNSVLVVTAIGFTQVEVNVNGRGNINATLQTSSSQLEQVVV